MEVSGYSEHGVSRRGGLRSRRTAIVLVLVVVLLLGTTEGEDEEENEDGEKREPFPVRTHPAFKISTSVEARSPAPTTPLPFTQFNADAPASEIDLPGALPFALVLPFILLVVLPFVLVRLILLAGLAV